MKKLIIIPAYNEEKNIYSLIQSIDNNNKDYDYIVVNDASTDGTLRLCKKNKFNYINLYVNLGIGGCVQTGYKYARDHGYDIAVQLDGDGQHDVKCLDEIYSALIETKSNMVIGSRFIKREGFQSTLLRRIGILFLSNLLLFLTSKKIYDVTSGLRMCDKSIINEFAADYPADYPEPESLVTMMKKGYHISECPVEMKEREHGESSINLVRSIYYMVKVSLAMLISRV